MSDTYNTGELKGGETQPLPNMESVAAGNPELQHDTAHPPTKTQVLPVPPYESLTPGAAFGQYHLVQPLKVVSAEADLWLVENRARQIYRVLKLYRYGVVPKPEIIQALRHLRREDIVEIIETGEIYGRQYEIQEYIEHGSLSDLIRQRKVGAAHAKVILEKLCSSLTHLHNINVLHRDIKPSNILVRSLNPLDVVLTDFGISSVSDHSLHLTTVNRTAAYCAPEALTGVIAKASDWWSVGMIMLELVCGYHPFAGLSEQAINFQLVSKGVQVPETLPEEWRTLIRGLLTRDQGRRWGSNEVKQWLRGKMDIPVYADEGEAAHTTAPVKPYRFGNIDCTNPMDLAVAMAQDWEQAVRHFGRGMITEWIKNHLYDQQLTSILLDIAQDPELNADQRVTAALLAMHPEMPLVYHGVIITPEWFPQNVFEGIDLLRSGIPRWQELLRPRAWLKELRSQRRDAIAELKRMGVPFDIPTSDSLLFSNPSSVIEKAMQHRTQFGGAKNDLLCTLLVKRELTLAEAVLLLSCEQKLLLDHQEAERVYAAQFKQEIILQLRGNGISYNNAKLEQILAGSPEAAIAQAEEFRSQYADCKNNFLSQLKQKESLCFSDAVFILVSDPKLWLDQNQASAFSKVRNRQQITENLRKTEIDCDWALVEKILNHEEMLPRMIAARKANYMRSWHPTLAAIFGKETYSLEEGLLLVAAAPRYFVSRSQAMLVRAKETVDRVNSWCHEHPVYLLLAVGGIFLVGTLLLSVLQVVVLAVILTLILAWVARTS